MAEKVNAFKSKYSGEQMEIMFDSLENMDFVPTGTLTTTFPYARTTQRFETDNLLITSNHVDKVGSYSGTGGMVESLIHNDTNGIGSGNQSSGYDFFIAYEFKNNIKIKLNGIHLRVVEGSNWGSIYFKFYYIDLETGEEKFITSKSWTLSSAGTKKIDIDVTEDIRTSKIITKCLFNGNIQYLAYDFEILSEGNYATNSLMAMSMQNNFGTA